MATIPVLAGPFNSDRLTVFVPFIGTSFMDKIVLVLEERLVTYEMIGNNRVCHDMLRMSLGIHKSEHVLNRIQVVLRLALRGDDMIGGKGYPLILSDAEINDTAVCILGRRNGQMQVYKAVTTVLGLEHLIINARFLQYLSVPYIRQVGLTDNLVYIYLFGVRQDNVERMQTVPHVGTFSRHPVGIPARLGIVISVHIYGSARTHINGFQRAMSRHDKVNTFYTVATAGHRLPCVRSGVVERQVFLRGRLKGV